LLKVPYFVLKVPAKTFVNLLILPTIANACFLAIVDSIEN